jgi:hypothetical protein
VRLLVVVASRSERLPTRRKLNVCFDPGYSIYEMTVYGDKDETCK